jgi:uncharacterized protein
MLPRALAIPLHRASQSTEPILVHGPRSSGKSTLLRQEFPAHTLLSLEDPAVRLRARQDPASFLARLRGPAFIDDLHRAPELVHQLAIGPAPRRLVVASSRRLHLPVATFELYPPTRAERQRRPPVSLDLLGRFAPGPGPAPPTFPAWPPARSFLDFDVRELVNLREMDRFERFYFAAAEQSGQLLDQQALARQCGVSHRTAVRWLAVLDTCFQTLHLPSSSQSFGRRLLRAPKIHFLASECFESQVVTELYRNACHAGRVPRFQYWKDSNGLEVPLLVEQEASPVVPVAIAAEATPPMEIKLRRWMTLAGVRQGALITNAGGGARRGGVVRYALPQL